MTEKEKKPRGNKKRKSDSDGVTVKRSYYGFSKYYPGGGSSQKYRRVMKETEDEHKSLKIALTVLGLVIAVFIGYITTTAALDVSYAPTTEEPSLTAESTSGISVPGSSEQTSSKKETQKATTEPTTVEEPEREVNVTSLSQNDNSSEQSIPELTESSTELFTGY